MPPTFSQALGLGARHQFQPLLADRGRQALQIELAVGRQHGQQRSPIARPGKYQGLVDLGRLQADSQRHIARLRRVVRVVAIGADSIGGLLTLQQPHGIQLGGWHKSAIIPPVLRESRISNLESRISNLES
jgi:hypothetical protein